MLFRTFLSFTDVTQQSFEATRKDQHQTWELTTSHDQGGEATSDCDLDDFVPLMSSSPKVVHLNEKELHKVTEQSFGDAEVVEDRDKDGERIDLDDFVARDPHKAVKPTGQLDCSCDGPAYVFEPHIQLIFLQVVWKNKEWPPHGVTQW